MNEAIEFEKGCVLFDAENFFEAHEVWEQLWNAAQGERRLFLQGMIQIAVALHHAGKGNLVGAKKLLSSGADYLDRGRAAATVVDVDRLIELARNGPLPFFRLPVR